MRLDISILAVKEFASTSNAEFLEWVSEVLSSIVSLVWISFGILIREDGSHSFVTGTRDIVLRRDEFDS
jgi:hypothetical protein